MSLKYCVECGQKHEYTLEIPRFCSNCGKSFGGEAKAKQVTKTIVSSKKQVVEHEYSDEDADKEVPQISEIQVELETDAAPKITFGSAKNARSFARDKTTKPLTETDLSNRLDELFQRDRENQKDTK